MDTLARLTFAFQTPEGGTLIFAGSLVLMLAFLGDDMQAATDWPPVRVIRRLIKKLGLPGHNQQECTRDKVATCDRIV
ncbi:MAG TPA: hypothetical protein V6D17_06730 [Candidatus Obscuribacterales bacterium]